MSEDGGLLCRVPRPPRRNPRRVSHATGLGSIRFRSPLLTESLLFSLPPGTEMFHFPGFPPPALYIQAGVTPHHGCRVPPFGHPRINARLTAPRGLSRPPTSFIGSWYQGIHHAPLHTYTPRHTPNQRGGCGTPAHTRAHTPAFGTHQKISTLQQPPHPTRCQRSARGGGGRDARIHYPVHKHPPTIPPPHHPDHTTRPRTQRCAGTDSGLQGHGGPGTKKTTPAQTGNPAITAGLHSVAGCLFPQDPTVRRPPPATPEQHRPCGRRTTGC